MEFTDEFEAWWPDLTAGQQEANDAGVELLMEYGPGLGRPLVDTIRGSRYSNMKELRISKGGALRTLFAFDPRRAAILLTGGDKSGRWEQRYEEAIPLAEDLLDEHLRSVEA